MKEEEEIFEEWYELNFEGLPDSLEYIFLRDSLDFQRYLLRYRYKELVESIRGELLHVFSRLISKAGSIRRKRERRDK